MTKKPRNKKYSPFKQATLTSHIALKNAGIVFTCGSKATVIDLKCHRIIPATKPVQRAILNIQHSWRVYIVVFLETSTGEQYSAIRDCSPERPCYQTDIMDTLNVAHEKLIASTKLADRVNVGWLAIPGGKELSERDIVEAIEVLPVWINERGTVKLDREKTTDELLKDVLTSTSNMVK